MKQNKKKNKKKTCKRGTMIPFLRGATGHELRGYYLHASKIKSVECSRRNKQPGIECINNRL